MKSQETWRLWRFRWHFLFALLIVVAALSAAASQFLEHGALLLISRMVLPGALLVGFFSLLLLLYENVCSINENGQKLETAVELANRNRELLTQISRHMCLSDSARQIAFGDIERMELAEAVLGKLHQRDFDTTFSMIESMARHTEHKALAKQLRATADKFRTATEEEQIEQIITHVQQLCNQCHWAQAQVKISKLLNGFPDSDKAKEVLKRYHQAKDKRKKDLLEAWDDAVKLQQTDRSLEILKELDLYLSPSEGLALQESASSVFRTKLHNLGMEFSLAVTEKNWQKALEAGDQIVADFPNSKMAHEIRDKKQILQQCASEKS